MKNSEMTEQAQVFYAVEDGGYWEVWDTMEEAEKDAANCIADENYSGYCSIHTLADGDEWDKTAARLASILVDQPDTDVNRRPMRKA